MVGNRSNDLSVPCHGAGESSPEFRIIQRIKAAVSDNSLTPTERLVLIHLMLAAGAKGEATWRHKAIATALGFSERTVQRCIAKLAGRLTKQEKEKGKPKPKPKIEAEPRGFHRANRYKMPWHGCDVSSPMAGRKSPPVDCSEKSKSIPPAHQYAYSAIRSRLARFVLQDGSEIDASNELIRRILQASRGAPVDAVVEWLNDRWSYVQRYPDRGPATHWWFVEVVRRRFSPASLPRPKPPLVHRDPSYERPSYGFHSQLVSAVAKARSL